MSPVMWFLLVGALGAFIFLVLFIWACVIMLGEVSKTLDD